MCRIQQELSSKIQEKKAAENQEVNPGEGGGSSPAEAPLIGSEQAADRPVVLAQGDRGLGAEEHCRCGRESVGTVLT